MRENAHEAAAKEIIGRGLHHFVEFGGENPGIHMYFPVPKDTSDPRHRIAAQTIRMLNEISKINRILEEHFEIENHIETMSFFVPGFRESDSFRPVYFTLVSKNEHGRKILAKLGDALRAKGAKMLGGEASSRAVRKDVGE
ncbi:Uncharacterised protein [Candidatus Norongarragalina meridionalis]|nr:Uncharacterised protein [Candidatus Norongarragalina meridionalis]